jgi:16S rRNA (cytosine1402-N4)-methyltransferase
MVAETLDYLALRPDGVYVDATLGGGGHSRALLDALGPSGRVVGLDQDADAIAEAARWSGPYRGRFTALHASFEDLTDSLESVGIREVDGVLFDLGVSSYQLDAPSRGFSFRAGGPLDMRMDASKGSPLSDLLARWSQQELEELIRTYGEERFAHRIARAITAARDRITDTQALAEIIRAAVPRTPDAERIHPATRTFQALRIAANREMEVLPDGLRQAVALLRPGGRIVALSYHSLEDRVVKGVFRDEARGCICPPRLPQCGCGRTATLRVLTGRPLRPSEAEVARNPRARSARMRAAERLPAAPAAL